MTVIMPVWIVNEELLSLTKETIASLGDVKLVIIDNGSPLGGGYLRSVADVYIRNKTNLGYAKAVNQGLKLCVDDEFVAVANNDIRVSPNWQWVAKMVFKENPNTYSCHFRMTDYDVPFEYGTAIVHKGKERWCTSSFFVINQSMHKQYYDENYLNSYDDWDYWTRAINEGHNTAYTDLACYQHKHSSTQTANLDREKNNLKNREYFKTKWGEYPEDRFARLYPEQMAKPYWEGFQL